MSISVNENIKRQIPWFIKIPAKMALSRLPLGARRWQKLNIFRAGAMDDPEYAFSTFKKHHAAGGAVDLHEASVLELGPGNSLLTALFARSLGSARTFLVDGERLTSESVSLFLEAEQMLSHHGLASPGVNGESLDGVLQRLNATYLTQGLASFQAIPDAEVDFLFSNAVLEHVRLGEFVPLIRETRRVLKPSGVASHVIDFRDHLQNGLNNLRFSERLWESEFMARSGFYTNRLSRPAMEEIFAEAGFQVEVHSLTPWPDGLPTSQRSMARPFRNRPAEEFMTMVAHVVLRPRA